jgi:hypothetical protein
MAGEELRKAVVREYRRHARQSAPAVREGLQRYAADPRVQSIDFDFALAMAASQSVIRQAMEAALQEAMPQGKMFFGELAIRCACYLLTALPADDQERAALIVRDGILSKLADMQAQGLVIKTEWE